MVGGGTGETPERLDLAVADADSLRSERRQPAFPRCEHVGWVAMMAGLREQHAGVAQW